MTAELYPAWRFRLEGLSGYISAGQQHGVEFTEGIDGAPVTRRMCLDVEHYYSLSCPRGRFVPRYEAEKSSERLGDDAVRIVIAPHKEWRVETQITYRVLPERIVEARYDFSFDADYLGFEAFISNYFHEADEPFLHLDGRWVQPRIGEKEHVFWARSAADAENTRRLHSEVDSAHGMSRPVDPLYYDHPIMITPIRETGWAVVNMAERDKCSSLSANRRWRAHDLSLVGQDVARGQVVSCRAWMAYLRLESMDQALSLYRDLVKPI